MSCSVCPGAEAVKYGFSVFSPFPIVRKNPDCVGAQNSSVAPPTPIGRWVSSWGQSNKFFSSPPTSHPSEKPGKEAKPGKISLSREMAGRVKKANWMYFRYWWTLLNKAMGACPLVSQSSLNLIRWKLLLLFFSVLISDAIWLCFVRGVNNIRIFSTRLFAPYAVAQIRVGQSQKLIDLTIARWKGSRGPGQACYYENTM